MVCLTALLRDLHLTYPGEFETDFNTTVTPIWENNPYITRLWNHDPKKPSLEARDVRSINCTYGQGLHDQNRETIHFCAYFHRDFEAQTGIHVPVHYPHGDLHLSQAEKDNPPVKGRYWLVLTGGKSDFTIKVWHTRYFQEVSDRIGEMGLGVVQTGAAYTGHWQPPLTGDHVVNLVGWGGFREFLQQVYHAEGIICGVTAAMHMAAALHKPCIVLAGGREAWWWEAYVNENTGFGPLASGKHPMPHRFLHTIGQLDCCKYVGCWKNKVVKIDSDNSLCSRPVITPVMPIAECMQMITPEHVMAALKSYYEDGSLPPIDLSIGKDRNWPVILQNTEVFAENPQKPVEVATEPVPMVRKAQEIQQTSPTLTADSPVVPPETHDPNRMRAKTTARVVLPAGVPLVINPTAKASIEAGIKKAATKPGLGGKYTDDSVADSPEIGGKVTIFVLFYGDFHVLHKKCLSGILTTVPRARLDLRVGTNQVCNDTLDMINTYVSQGVITKHYYHADNAYKYPVMREMFHDPEHPITTKWVLWFDDDSLCDVEPAWFNIICSHINAEAKKRNAHMVGAGMRWSTNDVQRRILSSRPWYKNKPWRSITGAPAPNGTCIIFVHGGFWAITAEAIKKADIPDLGTGLTHNGGDWQIGEQLYQAGLGILPFNNNKQFVRTSSEARRGVTMPRIDQVGATDGNSPTT